MELLVLIPGAFILSVFLSELVLRGTKLQTGLAKVVATHAVVIILLLGYLFVSKRFLWPTVLIFWTGAFLTWFGVRSHMESSILLRMLFLLRGRSVRETGLLQEYESHYGPAQRLEELFRGGLLERTPAGAMVTSKGKFILRVVSFLK